MARVETYEVQPLGITPPRKQTVIDITGFAKGVSEVSKAFTSYANSMRIADRQSKQIEIDEHLINERLRISTLKGGKAVGELEKFEKSRDKYIDTVLKSETNPRSREELSVYLGRRINQHTQWLAQYEYQQGDVYRQQIDTAYRQNAQRKLIGIPIGDIESIEMQVNDAVEAAKEREGEGRWSAPIESVYRQATRDEFYVNKIMEWYRESPDEAHVWFSENRDFLKKAISPKVYNRLTQLHKDKSDEADIEALYKSTFSKYGNNFLGASLALAGNPTKAGQAVSSRMYSNYLRQKAQTDRRREIEEQEIANNISETIADISKIEDPVSRNQLFDNFSKVILGSTVLTLDEKRKVIENVSRLNLRVVPEKVRSIYESIEDGTIDSIKDITVHYGDGIGSSITPYVTRLNRRQALQGKGNIDYFKEALNDFDSTVRMFTMKARRSAYRKGGDPGILLDVDKDLFTKQLRAFMQQNDLSNFDPQVREEANRMLAVQTKEAKTLFRSILEAVPLVGAEPEEEFSFKAEPEEEVTSEETVSAPVVQFSEQEFNRLLANPSSIPGEDTEEKANYLRNMYETSTGNQMSNDNFDILRRRIDSGG